MPQVLDESDLELVTYCRRCVYKTGILKETCIDCNGLRATPTDFGERVLRFVRQFKDWELPD